MSELAWVLNVVVTWLYILPDWVGCSNGMIWVSLDGIFQWDFRSDSHMTLYITDGVGCSNGMIWVSSDSIFDAISDLMVTWLYILPDWAGCSNGMIWVSSDSIFWCDFRSDGHVTLYITRLGRLLKWDDMGIIKQHFLMRFRIWWSCDSIYYLIGKVAQMGWYRYH